MRIRVTRYGDNLAKSFLLSLFKLGQKYDAQYILGKLMLTSGG